MHSFRIILFCAALLALAWIVPGRVYAGVRSGKIAELSSTGELTLQVGDGDQKETFQVPEKAQITLDGKKAKLADLTAGLKVSVFTDNSNVVTRLAAKTAAAEKDSESKLKKTAKKGTSKTRKSNSGDEATSASNGDWPQFLGPNRDNISQETGLLKKWPSAGPKLLWTARGLGAGFSPVAVVGDTIYTMGNQGQDETVLAVKLQDGKPLWMAKTGGRAYHEGQGDGPRGTPTVDGDFLFALGATGDLVCLEIKAGQVSWSKNILREFGGNNLTWGICESVLIDGDRLICTPGGTDATMVALDKKSGDVVWKAKTPSGDRAGYASAIPIEVGGIRQYVQFTANGTIGIRAEDGQFLWRDNSSANGTANCSAPIFYDNMVFSSSGYGTGGAMVQLTPQARGTKATFKYHTKNMKSHHGGMVVIDGFIYGCDEQILACLDMKTGKPRWQDRTSGKGSITSADGNLIIRNEQGPVTIAQATPTGFKQLGRFDPPNRSNRPAWSYPVVAHGKLFLRDQEILQCYELMAK